MSETLTSAAALATSAPRTMPLRVADQEIVVQCRYHAGFVMDDADAVLGDTARARQFTNNQNALYEARKKGTNKTPQPTAAELAEMFKDYMPKIGDEPSKSAVEKMWDEAAWRFWTARATRHNDGVRKYLALPVDKRPADAKPHHVKAGWKEIPLTFNATYELNDDGTPKLVNGKKVIVATAPERKEEFISRLRGVEEYKDAIAKEYAKVQAEKGKESAAPAVERATVDDLL